MKGFRRPSRALCCSHYPPLTFPSANNKSRLLIDFPTEKQTLTKQLLFLFTPSIYTCSVQKLIFKPLKKEQSGGGAWTVRASIPCGVLWVEQGTNLHIIIIQNRINMCYLVFWLQHFHLTYNINQEMARSLRKATWDYLNLICCLSISPSCVNTQWFLIFLRADLSFLLWLLCETINYPNHIKVVVLYKYWCWSSQTHLPCPN